MAHRIAVSTAPLLVALAGVLVLAVALATELGMVGCLAAYVLGALATALRLGHTDRSIRATLPLVLGFHKQVAIVVAGLTAVVWAIALTLTASGLSLAGTSLAAAAVISSVYSAIVLLGGLCAFSIPVVGLTMAGVVAGRLLPARKAQPARATA
jgi:hypothetical protein